ncbi:hypothetical protein [Natronococcus wangiae]|uniref:hypothetical protein n=1 Tax=Natronococcus wangiae TaxID=3068275 RepID=UPI00273ECF61|nr:hypothetical protein [Natronococcus sp. AD5]
MDDEHSSRIDNPELLCDAIISILEELEAEDILEEERVSELRSQIYRSIDTPDGLPEE